MPANPGTNLRDGLPGKILARTNDLSLSLKVGTFVCFVNVGQQ